MLICLPGEIAKLPREKPLEHDGHDEADSNNTENENKREVKDHRRRASNGVGINEADGGEILETEPKPLLLRAIVVHGQIFPVIGAVRCLHIVENTWVADLCSTKPLQKPKIKSTAGVRILKKLIHHGKITNTHDSKTARLRFVFLTSSQA